MIAKLAKHKEKLYLMQLASLQILINFGTNFYIVHKIGFNKDLDIYYISLAIFGFLVSSVAWSISSVLTPILIENREKKIEGELFISILLIVFPLFLALILSMPFWLKFIYINYLDSIKIEKIFIIQLMAILAFLIYSLNILFISIFQADNRYITINLLNILSSIVGFLFIFLTINKYNIYAVSMYQLVIQLALFGIMITLLIKQIRFRFDRNILSLLWHRMKYIFFGSFYYKLGNIVDKFIASFFSAGVLSLIGFIEKIYGAIITVLNTSIAGPTITRFSNLIKEKRFTELNSSLYKYISLLFVINISIFISVLLFGKSIFLYLFRGTIDNSLSGIIFYLMVFLFAIVFGKTIGQVLHNLLLSLRLEKEISILDSITFTIDIFLKVSLTTIYGLFGFISSIVISEIINTSAKFYLAYKRVNKIEQCVG